MAKSLSERIAERAAKKKPSRNGQNRAAFLALRVDIELALADGWPVKTIWETLHEERKVAFSYQAFRSYVNKLIVARKVAEPAAARVDQAKAHGPRVAATPAPPAAAASTAKPAKAGGFTFQATPKKEDLL